MTNCKHLHIPIHLQRVHCCQYEFPANLHLLLHRKGETVVALITPLSQRWNCCCIIYSIITGFLSERCHRCLWGVSERATPLSPIAISRKPTPCARFDYHSRGGRWCWDGGGKDQARWSWRKGDGSGCAAQWNVWRWKLERISKISPGCVDAPQLGSSHRQTWLSPCQLKLISIADLSVTTSSLSCDLNCLWFNVDR